MLFGSDVSDLYLQPHVGVRRRAAAGSAQGRRSSAGAVDDAYLHAAHRPAGTRCAPTTLAHDPDALLAACGVPRDAGRGSRRALRRRRAARDLRVGDGAHAPRARRRQRARARQPGARARLARPARRAGCCRSAATRTCRASARSACRPALKTEFARRLDELYGMTLPDDPGAAHAWRASRPRPTGRIDAALLLGGNLFAGDPDRAWARHGAAGGSGRRSTSRRS